MTDSEFVGARLELARNYEGLTLKALAGNVSASFGLLSHYENGLRKHPSPDLVSALAETLRVQPPFFYQPVTDAWRESECSFRRRIQTPESVKKRARAHGTMIDMVVRELKGKVKFPAYNVPSIPARSSAEIEAAANRCRTHWGLTAGPIQQVGRIAEHNGVMIVQNLRHSDKIDAFARRGDISVIVLNTVRTSTSRWIFDIAHELGHFVLHSGIQTGSKETEEQANYFASAFLLPKTVFAREFAARPFSWAHVFDLKRRWLVSASAIIRRAFNLGLIDAVTYRRCYQQMSVRGWLKSEPYEPEFVGPEWLHSAFNVLRTRYHQTTADICERLHLTAEAFTEITGVPVETSQPARFRPKLVKA